MRQASAVLGILMLTILGGCSASSACGPGTEQQGDMCVPICVEACGDHETCNVTETAARCECVVGYAGDPCVWTGGIQDPGFGDSAVWQNTNGAVILPLATGPTGPGIASFESSVACSAGAVSQVVEMPSYDDAEPFKIQVTWREANLGGGVEVGYGRAFRRLRKTVEDWDTDSFCLGEAGYGGPVKFQVAAGERWPNCFTAPTGTIEVDSFEIVVADPGECPAPGELVNGEANDDEAGWEFEIHYAGSGATTASLEPGVGESGSSGARIYKPAGGSKVAGMFTQLSVPLPDEELPSPALRFWWKGSEAWWYSVELGSYPGARSADRSLDTLIGDGTEQTATYCLPPWTHGNVSDLSFILRGGSNFSDETELVIDNVEIIDDPRCGDFTDLLDPSFDSAPNRWPGVNITFEEEPTSSVRVVNDPTRAAPPGSGLLELRYGSNQARLESQHYVWVPPSEGNRGPQLRFQSNVPADPGLGVFWTLGTLPPAFECLEEYCPATPQSEGLPLGVGWQPNAVCLPAEWADRWYRVRILIRPSDNPFEAYDPAREVLLDNFEVTLDERCPTTTP